jgi:hypothetical protein
MIRPKPYFNFHYFVSRNNLPTVQLQTWELNANLYDGTSTAGPVPTIFSDDQQATIDALVGDPAQAHKDMMKINRYKDKIHRNTEIFLNLYTLPLHIH